MWGLFLSIPAWAGWIAVGPDGQCAPTHPPRHRIEVVSDTFKKKDDIAALEDGLRARALDALLAKACAGRSTAECAAIRARTGLDLALDLEKRVACAAALVASDVVDDPTGEAAQKRALTTLARQTATKLDGKAVGEVRATWATGCSAGPAGARLSSLLRAALTDQGVAIHSGQQIMLEARLAPGDPVVVELWLSSADAPWGELVASTPLSAAWLGVHGGTADRCAGTDALGLTGGNRAGADSLGLVLHVTATEPLCPGEATRAVIRPSRAAQVQLWSVARSGEAWLAWTSPEPISSRVSLELEAAYIPAMGEELLVAVAVPPDATLPTGRPGCRVGSLQGIPATAAVAAQPLSILPPGRERCTAVASVDASAAWREFQAAPACY